MTAALLGGGIAIGAAHANEISGVQIGGRVTYRVDFENDPALRVSPAQTLTITHELDGKLDPNTFHVGDFGFGDTFVEVPEGQMFFSERLDPVGDQSFLADVFTGANAPTATMTWHFVTIDPSTGERPEDPFTGFLPLNEDPPEGQGFVTYSVGFVPPRWPEIRFWHQRGLCSIRTSRSIHRLTFWN